VEVTRRDLLCIRHNRSREPEVCAGAAAHRDLRPGRDSVGRAPHVHASRLLLRASKIGTFTQALYDEAKSKGWTVISMKNDWKRVFA
jgi:hypothetical protein